MVAQQILVLFVQVRILVRQRKHIIQTRSQGGFFFSINVFRDLQVDYVVFFFIILLHYFRTISYLCTKKTGRYEKKYEKYKWYEKFGTKKLRIWRTSHYATFTIARRKRHR